MTTKFSEIAASGSDFTSGDTLIGVRGSGPTDLRWTPAQLAAGIAAAGAPLSGANGGTGVANTGMTLTLTGNFSMSGAFSLTLTVTGDTNVTLPTSGTLLSSADLPLSGASGGTGVANSGKTITLGGNLETSGAFAATFTLTGTTNVTFPTSGTLAVEGSGVLPVGGSTGQALIKASGADFDVAWGAAAVVGGGTGRATLTAFNVLVGAGTSQVTLVAPGATGIPLISQGAASNPAFGTATVPGGGTGATTFTANTILIGQGTSAIIGVGPMTNGQVLVGQTGTAPQQKTISGDATLAASGALTIASAAVTLAKMANLAEATIIGRASGAGTGVPTALTGSQVATIASAITTTGGQTITGGVIITVFNCDTANGGPFTAGQTNQLVVTNGPHQKMSLGTTGGAAVNITAPASDGELILKILNDSGGTVTAPNFQNFDKVLTGDTFATANGKINWVFVYAIDGIQAYMIKNMN